VAVVGTVVRAGVEVGVGFFSGTIVLSFPEHEHRIALAETNIKKIFIDLIYSHLHILLPFFYYIVDFYLSAAFFRLMPSLFYFLHSPVGGGCCDGAILPANSGHLAAPFQQNKDDGGTHFRSRLQIIIES
jgi:hypothetical protein